MLVEVASYLGSLLWRDKLRRASTNPFSHLAPNIDGIFLIINSFCKPGLKSLGGIRVDALRRPSRGKRHTQETGPVSEKGIVIHL
jgi:hypothetical protein